MARLCRAQKPSRYEAEMSALYEALKSSADPMVNACKLFGKLMVDLANKTAKLGLPHGALDTATPKVITANTKATEEYAASLAKEGGLAKFPFAANMLHRVFGPLHPSGKEPDFSEAAGMPFHCAMYAIRLDYLENRCMLNYIGDDFMNDVILTPPTRKRRPSWLPRAGTARNPAKGRKPPASGEAPARPKGRRGKCKATRRHLRPRLPPVTKGEAMDHNAEESHAALDPTTSAMVVSTPMMDAFGDR
ncbi:MAG: hypothetical protein K2X00_21565 [Nitrospiraceae bacterium]|nr:hypothetical protein [Nitrospiraceae bacterium]